MAISVHGSSVLGAALVIAACSGTLSGGNDGPGTAGSGAGSSQGGSGTGAGASGVPPTDPGRVTLHRLNRAEYNNTVRDLLGTSLRPADEFPIDDRGSGFDNMANVLSVSPLHLSLYNSAAETLVTEALGNAGQRPLVVGCDLAAEGESCARVSLSAFARRAFRRPVTDAEVTRLFGPIATAIAQGEGYEKGMALAMRAVLLSPHFVFRVELDPAPTSLEPHPLTQHELASRLSYFLWSSMPDDTLLGVADGGRLSDPVELRAQVERMLADPKAQALIDNFAGQWLYLRSLDGIQPDPGLYPDFDDELRASMRAETEALFREIAFGGLPADQLLTANFSFLNDRLAQHYQLPAVGSDQLTRVTLPASAPRSGLLSQGSFLTFTSHPNRTSPVLRGKWVMDQLLCSVIPPPPPDVDVSSAETASTMGLTQREVLELHRANSTCAACHRLMDPIGLGLENYDAIGAYRTSDGDAAIEAAGELPTGEPFTGPLELSRLIAARPEYARCMAQKLYTYALGRAPEPTAGHHDQPTLDALGASLREGGYAFTELVLGIAQSPAFLNRRGDPSQ